MKPILLGISGLAGSGKDTTADELVRGHRFVKVALADPLKRICRDVYNFTEDQLWGPSSSRNAPDRRYPRSERARIFAQELRSASEEAFRIAVAKEFGDEAAKHFLATREALQQLGTEWGRKCYGDTWIDKAIRTSSSLLGSQGHYRYDARKGLYWLPDHRDWKEADRRDDQKAQGVAIPDVRFKNEMAAIREAGGFVIRVKRAESGLAGNFAAHASEAEQLSVPDSYFDYVAVNDGPLEELPGKIADMIDTLKDRNRS